MEDGKPLGTERPVCKKGKEELTSPRSAQGPGHPESSVG